MPRLIDADAFKIEFCEKCNNVSCDAPLTNTDCFTMYMLDNTPTIEAEPVRHGWWNDGDPYCPICRKDKFRGLYADVWEDWKPDYCRNCGAKMDGDSQCE